MWKIINFSLLIICTIQQCSINGCLICPDDVESCVSCNSNEGFALSGITCCNMNDLQYPDGYGSCSTCDTIIPGCSQCQVKGLTTECNICLPGFEVSLSGACCDLNVGFALPNGVCQGCPEGCASCSTATGTLQCTLCSQMDNYFMSGTECCNTNLNLYPSLPNECSLCETIIEGCESCKVDGRTQTTFCEECDTDNGYHLSGATCCSAQQNNFPNNLGGCDLCSQFFIGCQTCSYQSNVVSCQTCDTRLGYSLSGGSCCNANIDAFPDGDNGCSACADLIPGCRTCIVDNAQTICDQCESMYELSGNVCCNTMLDQYPSGAGSCLPCLFMFNGCTQCRVSSGQTYCRTCDEENNFILSGNRCCDLSQNVFPDGLGQCKTCIDVIPGCISCNLLSGITQCDTCGTIYEKSGTICCKPSDNQYPNGAGGCSSCFSTIIGCTSCRVTNGVTQCMDCDTTNGYYRSFSTCCSTSANSYPDNLGGCKSCSSVIAGCTNCMMVSGVTACSACNQNQGYYKSGTTCCNSNQNRYPDGSGGCKACFDQIMGCTSCYVQEKVTKCSACNIASSYLKSGDTCCNTNANRYPDQEGGCVTCSVLVQGCVTCALGDDYNPLCIACNTVEGYEKSGGTCCHTPSEIYPDGAGGCIACSAKIEGCSSCTFKKSIIECGVCDSITGYELSGGACCDTRLDAFPNTAGGCSSCASLVTGCSTCNVIDGVTGCQACEISEGYEISGGTCCNIQQGAYPDGLKGCNSCAQVLQGCLQCEYKPEGTTCKTCDTGNNFQLSGGTCCNMNAGIFPDDFDGCSSCKILIKGCNACQYTNGQIECTFCDSDNGFARSGTTCCNTTAQFYPDGVGCSSCSALIMGCSSCQLQQGNIECISCHTSAGYELSGTTCCNTNAESYPNQQGGCIACSSQIEGCVSCDYISNTISCSSCDDERGYEISGGRCCGSSKDEFPNDEGSCSTCASLIRGCKTCDVVEGVTGCSVCDTTNSFYISGTMCCNIEEDNFPNQQNGCSSCSSLFEGCLQCKVESQRTKCADCDDTDRYALSDSGECCSLSDNIYPDLEGGCSACHLIIPGCTSCTLSSSGDVNCIACDTNLGYFRSGTTCCSSLDNFYPNPSGSCSLCSAIVSGCTDCDVISGLTKCQGCNTVGGYQLSGETCCNTNQNSYPNNLNGCSSCSTLIAGCSLCKYSSQKTQCTICNYNYSYELSGSICCHTDSGNYPDGFGSCDSCASIVAGCISCKVSFGQTICDECDSANQYELFKGSCCNTGADLYPNGKSGCSSCASIIQGCLSCDVQSQVTICNECDSNLNYKLSEDICCLENSDSYPDGFGSCASCASIIDGCESCEVVDGETRCRICDTENRYEISGGICCLESEDSFPDGLGGCKSCSSIIPGCIYCDVSLGNTKCFDCDQQNGYQLSGGICCNTHIDAYPDGLGSCSSCSFLITGCPECGVRKDGVTECTKCQQLDPNCQICHQLSTCDKCAQNYYLSETEDSCINCRQIDDHCSYCQERQNCLSCDDGFARVSPTSCQECSEVQYLNSFGNACVPCTTIHPNCHFCSQQSTCTRCQQNYALESPTTCTLCTENQVLSHDATSCVECSSIDPNCNSCSSEDICEGCIEGYFVVGFKSCQSQLCQDIDPYCRTCASGFCESCIQGYALEIIFNMCIACELDQAVSEDGQRCVKCSSIDDDCIQCENQNICTGCAENLMLIDQKQCGTCPEGYGVSLSQTECVACSLIHSECTQCSNEYTCTSCSEKFILDQKTNQCMEKSLLSTSCGNQFQLGEDCDDGNTNNDDGCSSTCTQETGWECENFVDFPSRCRPKCGNGKDDGEECDDGNKVNTDGCNNGCTINAGYVCGEEFPSKCYRTCGDGILQSGEACDDNNLLPGDGCDSICQEQLGWQCYTSLGSTTQCRPICGDELRFGEEECDNGPSTERDGCSSNCQEEPGWKCEGTIGEKSSCKLYHDFCGNGVYEYEVGERCDDGNKNDGDGCTANCVRQFGYVCDVQSIPNYCSRCGNFKQDIGEQCDDGNFNNGDGCSIDCQVELGFRCLTYFPPISCSRVPVCMDGSFDEGEECDDGNDNDDDGCTSQCKIVEGWSCSNTLNVESTCKIIPRCGNAVYEPLNEQGCDDGNNDDGDGCDESCRVETFHKCKGLVGEKSMCVREDICGDGWHSPSNREQCDDGNLMSGDGCHFCEIEIGWKCRDLSNQKSFCERKQITSDSSDSPDSNPSTPTTDNPTPNDSTNPTTTSKNTCGNGVIEVTEECDDGNQNQDDGCSPNCSVQENYECSGTRLSTCRLKCGNSKKSQQEECDDGNNNDGDGCDSECKVESGYSCDGICVSVCGNGIIDTSFSENCDDGNRRDRDGCSSNCRTESGWRCGVQLDGRSKCARICGNGFFQPNLKEKCDDGNIKADDGCYGCQIEEGWRCQNFVGGMSECTSETARYCRNGKYEPEIGEQCDDGNNINTDGCSNGCILNENFICVNQVGKLTTCGAPEPESSEERICVNNNALVDYILSSKERQILKGTQFGQVVTIRDIVSIIVTKNVQGQIVQNNSQYNQALGLYNSNKLYHEWWKVNYYKEMCTGER